MNCKDVGDLCTHCGRDTAPGGGLWVDRIPAYVDSAQAQEWLTDWEKYDSLDGYMCRECYDYEEVY